MGEQFLESLWPVLVIARYLGMFPIKKVWHENGTWEFNPVNWKIQWILFACSWLIFFDHTLEYSTIPRINRGHNALHEN